MKTKPYGVRFEPDQLEILEQEMGIKTAQKAVNFWADFWIQNKNVNFEVLRRLGDLKIIVGNPLVDNIEITKRELPRGKNADWDKYNATQIENKPQEPVSEPLPPKSQLNGKKQQGNDNSGIKRVIMENVEANFLPKVEKIDYHTLFEESLSAEVTKKLWEQMKQDPNVSIPERNNFKTTYNLK